TTAAAGYGFNAGLMIEEYNDASGGTLANALVLDEEPGIAPDTSALSIASGKVGIYPNPFHDQLTIGFNNSVASNQVVAEMYDLQGRLTYRKDFAHVPVGYNSLQLTLPV